MFERKWNHLALAAVMALSTSAVAFAQEDRDDNARQRERQEQRERERGAEKGQSDKAQGDNWPNSFHKASQLIGMRVDDEDDKKIGDIRNLAVNVENGHVRYAIVESGGTLYPIPLAAIKVANKRDRATVDTTVDRMKDAPTFKSDGWNTIGDTKWGEIVHEFYSIEKNPDYDRERPDFVPAGAVIGARVENRRGDNLGAVKDIVIDSEKNDVAYTVLQFGNDKLFAAPWESLNVSDGGKKIVIRGVEREDLEKAAGFANNRWPNYRDLGWEGDVNFDSRPPNWLYGFREGGGNRPDRPDRPNNNNNDNNNNNNDNDDDADRGAMGGWQTHGKYGQLFDRNKIERVRGKVVRSESVTPLSGMDPGVALTVRDDDGKNVVVHVGPEWFVRHQQDKFTEGEDVDVSGSRVNVDSKPVIMATQLRVRGRTLTLRNDNGVPAWDAWQERK